MTALDEVQRRAAVYRERQPLATEARAALRQAVRAARAEGHSERALQAATGFLVTNVTIHNWTRDLEPTKPDAEPAGSDGDW